MLVPSPPVCSLNIERICAAPFGYTRFVRLRVRKLLSIVPATTCVAILGMWMSSYFWGWTMSIQAKGRWDYWVSSERGCVYLPGWLGWGTTRSTLDVYRAGELGDVETEIRPHRRWMGVQVFDRSGGGRSAKLVAVSYWVPALLIALPVIVRFTKRRRRSGRGSTCSQCGYDLRATPSRCPECGLITN